MKTLIKGLIKLLLISIFIVTVSCSEDKKANVVIQGEIQNYCQKEITLQEIFTPTLDIIHVSKSDKNGNFKIEIFDNIDNSFYKLKFDDTNSIFLYLENNQNITIQSTYPDIPQNYSLTNSKDSELLSRLHKRLLQSLDSINDLRQLAINTFYIEDFNIDSLNNEISKKASSIFKHTQNYVSNFIYDNYKSPIIYVALFQYLDAEPIFNFKMNRDIFNFVFENIKTYNPNLKQLNYLEKIILTNNTAL